MILRVTAKLGKKIKCLPEKALADKIEARDSVPHIGVMLELLEGFNRAG